MWGRAGEHERAGMEEAVYKGRGTHRELGAHLEVQVREEDAGGEVYKRCAGSRQ